VRALQLQSVKDYSHLYENGIFAYFRSDYISFTLNLLCALEGTLLRFYRHHAAAPKDEPTVKELLNCFHDEPFQSRYENVNRWFESKRPVNPILKLGKRMPEVGAWKKRQLEECGYDVVGKR
jgi:hypothetical protein